MSLEIITKSAFGKEIRREGVNRVNYDFPIVLKKFPEAKWPDSENTPLVDYSEVGILQKVHFYDSFYGSPSGILKNLREEYVLPLVFDGPTERKHGPFPIGLLVSIEPGEFPHVLKLSNEGLLQNLAYKLNDKGRWVATNVKSEFDSLESMEYEFQKNVAPNSPEERLLDVTYVAAGGNLPERRIGMQLIGAKVSSGMKRLIDYVKSYR